MERRVYFLSTERRVVLGHNQFSIKNCFRSPPLQPTPYASTADNYDIFKIEFSDNVNAECNWISIRKVLLIKQARLSCNIGEVVINVYENLSLIFALI